MKKYIFFLLLLTICACRKDSEALTEDDSVFQPDTITVDDFTPTLIPVTASVMGKVLNEEGYPISDALVTLGSESKVTNEKGIFLFQSVEMNAAGTFIEVEKETAYFNGACRFFPTENSENYVTIQLLRKEERSLLITGEDLTLSLAGGIELTIKGNSLLQGDGTVYNGEAALYHHRVGPESENLLAFLPGNLQGINRKNEEVALGTYGMLAIELRDVDGGLLQLDRTKKARLSFPVFDTQIQEAPESIKFWSFNTNHGLWQDRGDALLENSKYIAEVVNFSFLQFAIASSMIQLSGTIKSETGLPLPNLLVHTNDFFTAEGGYAYTDNEGFFRSYVPNDRLTKLSVTTESVRCIDLNQEEETYQADTDLGTIELVESLDEFGFVPITGTLINCTDEAINDFFVEVNTEEGDFCFYKLSGNEVAIGLPFCSPTSNSLSVKIRDLDGFHESADLISDLGNGLNLGLLELCGDGAADYIAIKFPGTDAVFFYEPNITLDVSGDMTRLIGFEDTLSQIDIAFNGLTSGTYVDQDVNLFKGAFSSDGNTIVIDCANDCGFDEIVVEEYGTEPGDQIRGTFSGGSVFFLISSFSNTTGIQIPYEGEFKVTIE